MEEWDQWYRAGERAAYPHRAIVRRYDPFATMPMNLGTLSRLFGGARRVLLVDGNAIVSRRCWLHRAEGGKRAGGAGSAERWRSCGRHRVRPHHAGDGWIDRDPHRTGTAGPAGEARLWPRVRKGGWHAVCDLRACNSGEHGTDGSNRIAEAGSGSGAEPVSLYPDRDAAG